MLLNAMGMCWRVECARPELEHAPGLVGDYSSLIKAQEVAEMMKGTHPFVYVTAGLPIPPPHDQAHGYDGATFALAGQRFVLGSDDGLAAWREHYGLYDEAHPHPFGHHFVPMDSSQDERGRSVARIDGHVQQHIYTPPIAGGASDPLYTVPTGKVTLTSAATKSLILLAPATQITATLRAIDISLDASAAAAGVQFDFYRVNSLGSPAGTSTTPQLTDERDSAASCTALTALSTEPTSVFVIDSIYLQPLGGIIKDWQPFGAEGLSSKANGARYGLRYTTASGVTPDCLATFYYSE